MRKVNIPLLALSICALNTASVNAVETFTAYNLDISYTNSSAQYWSINGGPTTTGTSFLQIFPSSTDVQTDGSGKITGTGELMVTYNTAGVPYSVFYVDYTGRIIANATTIPTTVTLVIKGTGFIVDGSGQATTANNSINLKFVGQPGINPLNKNQTKILGNINGAIRGPTPIGNNPVLPAVQAVFNGNTSRASFLGVSPDVLQTNRRLQLFDSSYGGSGIINGTTYKMSGRGYGTARGATLFFSGYLGSYTNLVGTNAVGFTAPISADFKGKVLGQVVSGSATPGQINPNLIQ